MTRRGVVATGVLLVVAFVVLVFAVCVRPTRAPNLAEQRQACEEQGGRWVPDPVARGGFTCSIGGEGSG